MITAMKDYKEEKMKLKSLYVEKETEQVNNVAFIKM
jgi:hypothetical protein